MHIGNSFFIILAISLLFPLFISQPAFAQTEVSVSSNGDDSSSHVSVNSNATSTSNTHIRIEQNGEVQEYHSDKPEDVVIQSEDGKAKVSVQNGVQATPEVNNTPPVEDESSSPSGITKEKIEQKKKRDAVKEKAQLARKAAREKAAQRKKELKEKMQKREDDFLTRLESKLKEMQDLFSF